VLDSRRRTTFAECRGSSRVHRPCSVEGDAWLTHISRPDHLSRCTPPCLACKVSFDCAFTRGPHVADLVRAATRRYSERGQAEQHDALGETGATRTSMRLTSVLGTTRRSPRTPTRTNSTKTGSRSSKRSGTSSDSSPTTTSVTIVHIRSWSRSSPGHLRNLSSPTRLDGQNTCPWRRPRPESIARTSSKSSRTATMRPLQLPRVARWLLLFARVRPSRRERALSEDFRSAGEHRLRCGRQDGDERTETVS